MLSSDVPATPRPRPPAKLRRSASLYTRPKPQSIYNPSPQRSGSPANPRSTPSHASNRNSIAVAPSLPTLLGSPLSATSRLLQPSSRAGNQVQTLDTMPEVQEWFNEKSRQEVDQLFHKAESVIKERESELDITSAVCKSLRDSNFELMSKHGVLVSRLPNQISESPPASPSPSAPGRTKAHSPNTSLHDHSFTWSPKYPKNPMIKRQHSRRISTTPAELAFLSDQNAELQAKLHDLEADASRSEQAGRRRLRCLEKEIQGLKEELDRTRTASERLEVKVQDSGLVGASDLVGQGGLDADLLKLWKRLNREAKVRELRAKTRPWENDSDDSFKDFAPSNSLRKSTSNRHSLHLPLTRTTSTPARRHELVPPRENDVSPQDAETPSQVPTPPLSPLITSAGNGTQRERAIVSQLLLKIRELEETNTILSNEHLEARMKLRHAEEETENMKKLYEMITTDVGEELELEMEMVDDTASGRVAPLNTAEMGLGLSGVGTPRRTIKLRSIGKRSSLSILRRSMFTKSLCDDPFGAGINSHSSLRRDPFSTIDSVESDRWNAEGRDEDDIQGSSSSQIPEFLASGSVKKPRKPLKGLFDDLSGSPSPCRTSTANNDGSIAFPGTNDCLTIEELQPKASIPKTCLFDVPRSEASSEFSPLRQEGFSGDPSFAQQSPTRSDVGLPHTLASELGEDFPTPSNPPSPGEIRTLGDELCGNLSLSPMKVVLSTEHMRSRSIHDLLSKVEADAEGTPTPTTLSGGFAVAQNQMLSPKNLVSPRARAGGLTREKSTDSRYTDADTSVDEDREDEVFHDAPEFGSLRLRNRKLAQQESTRTVSTPTPSVRGVPVFSVDDLSFRPNGTPIRIHARRRVQSEASKRPPPAPRPRFIDLLNLWAWLQLLLSIAVIFVMAARLGPKAVVNRRLNA